MRTQTMSVYGLCELIHMSVRQSAGVEAGRPCWKLIRATAAHPANQLLEPIHRRALAAIVLMPRTPRAIKRYVKGGGFEGVSLHLLRSEIMAMGRDRALDWGYI